MYELLNRFTNLIDRLMEGRGMGLFFHPEWASGQLSAGHDGNGAFALELWRFEFVIDRGLRWLVRG